MEGTGQFSGERILVVDDTPANLRLIEVHLRSLGFEVTTAAGGREALELLDADLPDLVLLDVMMPEMDGFETCRRIKSGRRSCHLPVILVTALSAVEDKSRGLEAGADDFVSKPFDKTELLIRVRSMLRLGQMRTQLQDKVDQLEAAQGKLRRQAETDELTGLFNRRSFTRHVELELNRARRFRHEVSILLLDVDRFKRVNDTHGHATGDTVLQQLGDLLSRGIRTVDVCSRYGGEEFALMLPETSHDGAVAVAQNLLERIAGEPFQCADGQPLGGITVSIGVASRPRDGEARDALLRAADRRLYAAKDRGRNCVVSAHEEPEPTVHGAGEGV